MQNIVTQACYQSLKNEIKLLKTFILINISMNNNKVSNKNLVTDNDKT